MGAHDLESGALQQTLAALARAGNTRYSVKPKKARFENFKTGFFGLKNAIKPRIPLSTLGRNVLLCGAVFSLVSPALAQNAALNSASSAALTSPLETAIHNDSTPLSIQANALTADWRRFQPAIPAGADFVTALKVGVLDQSNAVNYQFVTRGQTLQVNGEIFLIAYRGKIDFEKIFGLLKNSSDESLQKWEVGDGYLRLLATQNLLLCLINVRTSTSLNDFRAFDPKTDTISPAQLQVLEEENTNAQVVSHLKQLGVALKSYSMDYDGILPPMRSAQSMAQIETPIDSTRLPTVQQAIYPYVKTPEIFTHPTTHQIYRPNLNLSRRNVENVRNPAQIVAFYEASPAPDGRRAVLYLDGHVARENENEWAKIRALSDQFAPPLDFKKLGKKGPTVRLFGAAALAYMLKRGRDDQNRPQTVYYSPSTGRLYYRQRDTKQAIWLEVPVRGLTVSVAEAAKFKDYQGYNGQKTGLNAGVFLHGDAMQKNYPAKARYLTPR